MKSTFSGAELLPRCTRFLKTLQRKLKLLQRKLRNKQKGSNNRHKLNQKIALIFAVGFDGYICKPYQLESLHRAIASCLKITAVEKQQVSNLKVSN